MDFIRLSDAFLDYRCRLQQDADFLQTGWNLDDEVRVVNVVLRKVAVAQIDTAFEVRVIGGHIVRTDLIVDASSRTAHSRNDVVAGLKLRYIAADSFHLAEAFVTQDQEVVA